MSEFEKVYQFNEYILGYDTGSNDRSCLTICKSQNDALYVMGSLYDGSADVITMILDSLQKQLQQKENIIKEVGEYIKDKWEMELKDSIEDFLDHDELIDRKRLLHILEILDKENTNEKTN